jgi:hypothetical protein
MLFVTNQSIHIEVGKDAWFVCNDVSSDKQSIRVQ